VKFHLTRHWLELANQWLEVTRQFLWLESDSTRPSHDSLYSTRKIFRWFWRGSDSKGLWLWLDKNDSGESLTRAHQRWADCEIFQSESSPDKIESDPILIRKIFENHQSDSVLIRQCKIMYFHFASWGKRTTGAILPLAKYDWLKAK